jgi:hypothetical protein
MGFAHLRPSGVVMGSNNPYVAFSTTWSRAAASTSISVSSDSVVGTPYCDANGFIYCWGRTRLLGGANRK